MGTRSDPVAARPDTIPIKRPDPMSRAPFQDVDRLSNAYGMVGIISQRLSNGLLTFSIHREFERDGETGKTAFIPVDLADVYLDFAKIVVERMRELRDAGNLPYPIRGTAT
jgi:hypothetical protein